MIFFTSWLTVNILNILLETIDVNLKERLPRLTSIRRLRRSDSESTVIPSHKSISTQTIDTTSSIATQTDIADSAIVFDEIVEYGLLFYL